MVRDAHPTKLKPVDSNISGLLCLDDGRFALPVVRAELHFMGRAVSKSNAFLPAFEHTST